MAELEIYQFPCLSDNFGVLVHDPAAGVTAAIDAPEEKAVRDALSTKGWSLTHILITHHHHDHVGGVASLKAETGCKVVGPKKDAHRIDQLDETVEEGDVYPFGSTHAKIFETPGHTSGHIVYWFDDAGVIFTGDTLFSLGCGRLFERPAEDMWQSLQKLMKLPRETTVYCGHEYTLANGEFALTIEPENDALQARVEAVRALRAAGDASLPTTIGSELDANPFLRPSSLEIRKKLRMEDASDVAVFAKIRSLKDKA